MNAPGRTEIKKLHLQETIAFAISTVPDVDQATLEGLLQLVNTEGTHGVISHERLIDKMRQVLKYVPGACARSLMILADLLELPISGPIPTLRPPHPDPYMPGISLADLLRTAVVDEAWPAIS